MIPTTRVLARDIPTLPALVPEHIDKNPWILYHATTSVVSDVIERDGFVARDETALVDALSKLLTIYHSIGWHGISSGGYAVLAGFSLRRNLASTERPVYFTTYAHRSPLYAQPDFAGGETAHGIRHAYRDLTRFLNEPAIRERNFESKREECISLVRRGGLPIRVISPDLDWLEARLVELEPVFRRLCALENSGQPGVIYAVEFTPDDLTAIFYSWSDGVSVYRSIPATRIRHKVLVDAPSEIVLFGNGDLVMLELWREQADGGLLAALRAQEGRRQTETTAVTAPDVLFDPMGGTDHAVEIAAEYGLPEVKELLAKSPTVRQPL